MAYFHCKNGNGGIAGVGTITIQDTQGNTITCTKGQTTLTKTVGASGEVIFDIPESGDWVVSNGTKSKTITIEPQDYEVTFLFTPVLYELGTFNAGYENPGDFWDNTFANRQGTGGVEINSDHLTLNPPYQSGYGMIIGFSDLIDLTEYRKVRFYYNQQLSEYAELDISSCYGEFYIAVSAGNLSGTRYVYAYACKIKTNLRTSTYYKTTLAQSNSKDIYKIELIK